MSKTANEQGGENGAAPVLLVQSSDHSNNMELMLRQGRSLSGNERNCFFMNTLGSPDANGRFATVSAVSGLDFPDDGRAAALVDWDFDGDLDIWLTNRNAPRLRFMRNEQNSTEATSQNQFVQFRLVGNGQETNRNAIGARITVLISPVGSIESSDDNSFRLVKTLRAGDGFMTQSSPWMHFGMGKGFQVDRVEVTWPNQTNRTEVFEGISPNHRYELVENSGEAKQVSSKREELVLKPSELQIPPQTQAMRVPIIHPLKAPQLGYLGFDGVPHSFPVGNDKVTLVNLWSTTCPPCVHELSQFAERQMELTNADVQILALCIDNLESRDDASKAAAEMAKELNLSFAVGMAPPSVIDQLQRRHNILIKMHRPLPMPNSFLFDRKGQLDVVYKGVVEVDTLLEDAKAHDLTMLERFVRAAAFDGIAIDDPVINSTLTKSDTSVMIKLAKEYTSLGKIDDAFAVYLEALNRTPEPATIYNELAIICDIQGKPDEAIGYYEKALDSKPDDPDLNVGLAQVLIRTRKYDEAKQRLDRALSTMPNHVNANYNMGLIFASLNDEKQEQASYEKVLEKKPDHAQALYRLGRLHEKKNEFTLATSLYEQAVKAAPKEAAVLTSLGRLYWQEKRLDDAEAVLQKAVESNPNYVESHYQLGQVFIAKGKAQDAIMQFQLTLRLDRNHTGSMNALKQLQQTSRN